MGTFEETKYWKRYMELHAPKKCKDCVHHWTNPMDVGWHCNRCLRYHNNINYEYPDRWCATPQ